MSSEQHPAVLRSLVRSHGDLSHKKWIQDRRIFLGALKYVPFATLKLLENIPMPWESHKQIPVIYHIKGALTIVNNVPRVIPPLYIAQWATMWDQMRAVKSARKHFNRVQFPPFDAEEPPIDYGENLINIAEIPDRAIRLDLNNKQFNDLAHWFYDQNVLINSSAVNGPSMKNWTLNVEILSKLYQLATPLAPTVVDRNFFYLFDITSFKNAKALNLAIPGGPKFEPLYPQDSEQQWDEFNDLNKLIFRSPIRTEYKIAFVHLYNSRPRSVEFGLYHAPCDVTVHLDDDDDDEDEIPLYEFDPSILHPIDFKTKSLSENHPSTSSLNECEKPIRMFDFTKSDTPFSLNPQSQSQSQSQFKTYTFQAPLESLPIESPLFKAGFRLYHAPAPFNSLSGLTKPSIDIPLIRSKYTTQCPFGQPVRVRVSHQKLLKRHVYRKVVNSSERPSDTVSLLKALKASKYFNSTKIDWVEAGLQLCRQGYNMLKLLIIKKKVEYLHLDYNFDIKAIKTLTTKERKKSRFGNAFHLIREILKMIKFVVDVHVKFRSGEIDSFRLADALFYIFSNIGEVTAMYRFKYRVMRQIRECKDLKHVILSRFVTNNFQNKSHNFRNTKEDLGVGFWGPLWRVWLLFLKGITPLITRWLGNLLRRQFQGRKHHNPNSKITKQRVESHFDVELRQQVLHEIIDKMPPQIRAKKTKVILQHLSEAWRCWKANIPWKVEGMPPAFEKLINKYVKVKADWWTSIAQFTRSRISRDATISKAAARKNLGRLTRIWLKDEQQRQSGYLTQGPFISASDALGVVKNTLNWVVDRQFNKIPLPPPNYKHATKLLKLGLETLKESYGSRLRLNAEQKAELLLVEKAYDNPQEVILRIHKHFLTQQSFSEVDITFVDYFTHLSPVYKVAPIEKITDAYLDQYLWYEASLRRLFPNWIKPSDDEPAPYLLYKWCQGINNMHNIWDTSNGQCVVLMSSIIHDFYQNVELTLLKSLLSLVVNENIAQYITSKNNVKLNFKDMEHVNTIGLIRGLHFNSFVSQYWGLVLDLLLLSRSRASQIAGRPGMENLFLSFENHSIETSHPIRGYQRYLDKIHLLCVFSKSQAEDLIKRFQIANPDPYSQHSKNFPSKACWPLDCRMRLLKHDVLLARATFWEFASRFPPSLCHMDWNTTEISVYSEQNPNLLFSMFGFEVRILPKNKMAQVRGRVFSVAEDEEGDADHLLFKDQDGVWDLINQDSQERTAQAHLMVSPKQVENFHNKIRRIMLSSGATTFANIANKWNSAIIGLLTFFREAVTNTRPLLDLLVKSENKIQNRIKMGLNSKMPSRFPPVVFYTPKELGGLGLLSMGYVLIPTSDLRFSKQTDLLGATHFVQGLNHDDNRSIPTLFRYIQPWENEFQDSKRVWNEYSIKRQTAMANNKRLQIEDVEDSWFRGVPRISTLFQRDRQILTFDKGWRCRLEFSHYRTGKRSPFWWTSHRHDGKLWNLANYREDVIQALGGVETILEHTLFKATYFPSWEGLFWERASGFAETMKFKKLTNAQRTGLSQIPNRRFALWWSPTINRADVYIGFQVQLDLTGIFMHAKIPTLKISLIQIFRAHLWQKIHESLVMNLCQILDQHMETLDIDRVVKESVHPRKSYKFNSTQADVVLHSSYKKWPISKASFLHDSEEKDLYIFGGDSYGDTEIEAKMQTIQDTSSLADKFWVDIQLRWGDYDRHNIQRYAKRRFLDFVTDSGVSQSTHYPSPYGIVIAFDLAYNIYAAYGTWFPGLKPLIRAALVKIIKSDPALYVMRERIRNALQLYSSTPNEPVLSSQNYGSLFSDKKTWFLDDSAVYRLSVHKTFEGNVTSKAINGALFVFNPRSGQLYMKIIHASTWAGQKRRAQLARWKSAEEVGTLLRALPPEQHPNQIIVTRKGMMDSLEVQLLEAPNIVLRGTNIRVPFASFLSNPLLGDQVTRATHPKMYAVKVYDDWKNQSFVCFLRLILILRALSIDAEAAWRILRPDASYEIKKGNMWPTLTNKQWYSAEVGLRNLILNDFCQKNGVNVAALNESEIRDVILGQPIATQSMVQEKASELNQQKSQETTSSIVTKSFNALGQEIVSVTQSDYEREQFVSKTDWKARAIASSYLIKRANTVTVSQISQVVPSQSTYILPHDLLEDFIACCDTRTQSAGYLFGRSVPAGIEIKCIVIPPQLGSTDSVQFVAGNPTDHPYLADYEPLGVIRCTQPLSEDVLNPSDSSASITKMKHLYFKDCWTTAQCIESFKWNSKTCINLSVEFTPGSLNLTAHTVTDAGLSWAQKFSSMPNALPRNYSFEMYSQAPLILTKVYSGFFLVPYDDYWNFHFDSIQFDPQRPLLLKIGEPSKFHDPVHRKSHFDSFKLFS